MLALVGRILYWLGSILAAAILLSDLVFVAWDDEPHARYSGYILIGYAFVVWLIGWTCRYVLSRLPADPL